MENDSRSGVPGKGALEEGGATTTAMPRARIEDDDGRRREWHSRMIPRYQRRTERVDEAILGVYLSGTNTRRLRGALSPLLVHIREFESLSLHHSVPRPALRLQSRASA